MIAATAALTASATLVLVNRRPPSSLTQGFGGQRWDQSTAIFDARLKRRFPVGTLQADLIAGLQREGFAPDWPSNEPEYEAVRKEGNAVCNIAARVFWKVDQAERVTSIRGRYREEGCL